jgi:hypothetical protein
MVKRPTPIREGRDPVQALATHGTGMSGRWPGRAPPTHTHDGVPWNNNPAEHAVRQFAHYREHVDGQITENGLNYYLVLFSICVTCKYKRVNVLKFLLSGENDIDVFWQACEKKRPTTLIQTHAEGVRPSQAEPKPNLGQGVSKGRILILSYRKLT